MASQSQSRSKCSNRNTVHITVFIDYDHVDRLGGWRPVRSALVAFSNTTDAIAALVIMNNSILTESKCYMRSLHILSYSESWQRFIVKLDFAEPSVHFVRMMMSDSGDNRRSHHRNHIDYIRMYWCLSRILYFFEVVTVVTVTAIDNRRVNVAMLMVDVNVRITIHMTIRIVDRVSIRVRNIVNVCFYTDI